MSTDTPEAAWYEPDGTPCQSGGHPHTAIWNHEARQWDIVGDGWTLVRANDEDMTTAYMVGYENGKDFAILHARAVHGCDHGNSTLVTKEE
jgi:hypothetical protein